MTKDMTQGSPLKLILAFAVPLMLGSLFQQFYNLADTIIVGRFVGVEALAAVGSVGGLNYLVLGFVNGIACGFSIPISWTFGAKDYKEMRRYTANTVWLSIAFATVLTIVTVAMTRLVLVWTNTPADIIDLADIYIRTIFAGIPFTLLYNVTSALMRALGDSKRPLYFLLFAGIVNVALNLFFVLVFHMDVAGVALATVIAQGIAAWLVLRCLGQARDACRLRRRNLRIDPVILKRMLWIGLPAGIQGMFFSISNITIQSSVNSFGSLAMAGNTATSSLEGFVYIGSNAFHQTVVSFVGQNLGGGRYDRIRRSILYCMACSSVVCLVMGFGFLLDGRRLLAVYNSNPEVIAWGMLRMKVLFTTYFLCGMMDVVSGALRGLGHSVMPAVITLIGVCVLRVVWVCTVFPLHPTMGNLMLSYPITWAVTAAANGLYLYWVCRRLSRPEYGVVKRA